MTTQSNRPILLRPEASTPMTRAAFGVHPGPSLAPPAQRNPAYSSGTTRPGEVVMTTPRNSTTLRRPEASTPAIMAASGVHPGPPSLPPTDTSELRGSFGNGFRPVPQSPDWEERFRPIALERRGGGLAPPGVRLPERPEYSGGLPRGRVSRGTFPGPRSLPAGPGHSRGASRGRNSRAANSFSRRGTGFERSRGVRGDGRSRANGLRRGGRALNFHASSSQHSPHHTPLAFTPLLLASPTASDRRNKLSTSSSQGNKK